MKTLISILFCCAFLCTCNAQSWKFEQYLNNFGKSELPISINDRQSYGKIFYQVDDTIFSGKKTSKAISEDIVEKYICKNKFCNSDEGYFRYDYGVKVKLSNDFTSVLVPKWQYEGNSEWDFDLVEILLITYSNKGEILSRQSLTKDNERWQFSLKISQEGIVIRQIKVTEPKIDQYHRDLHCEFWTNSYKINDSGIINLVSTTPVSSGILIWKESTEEYILKE